MKKGLWLGFGVFFLMVGYLVAGPFLTIQGLKAAAAERDKDALAQYVDFPVLRSNLKEQFNERLMGEMASQADNPFAAFGMLIASKLVDTMVDTMVTPAGIAHLMAGEKAALSKQSRHEEGGDQRAKDKKELLADASYSFKGVSKFVASVTSKDGKTVDFVLMRDGFSWRLSNIVLPEG